MLRQLSFISVCVMACACGSLAQQDTASPEVMTAGQTALSLDEILSTLPVEAQARIPHRHPKETVEFFGIRPSMTVVDTTPGDIWYTAILAAYLGPDGKIIGADRPLSVWESFGPEYATPAVMAEQKIWPTTWPQKQAEKYGADAVSFGAVTYAEVPTDMAGTADVVMMIREMHNIMSADKSNAIIETVLGEIHMMLKPGGVFGVVQHRAPETASDKWANGSNGYVKQSKIVALVEAAGFTLEAVSEINANPEDQPTEADYVWRLPPALDLPEDKKALREAMLEIGESDRITLKFRKTQ